MKTARFVAFSFSFGIVGAVVVACGDDNIATTDGNTDASSTTNDATVADSSSQAKDTGPSSDNDANITDASPQNNYDAAACGFTTFCGAETGPGPIDAGTVSGDTTPAGGNSVKLSGTTSEWLTLLVTEDDHSVVGRPLTLGAVLTAPAGVNFDLFLYQQTDGSTNPECTNVAGQSTEPAGKSDGVSLSWGEEGDVANTSDDTETITIRVQRVSGECDSANGWTLTLTGNTG